MKKVMHVAVILAVFFTFSTPVLAQNGNAYVNVVIPVRGREYWQDFNRVIPLLDMLRNKNIPVTLLVQYRILSDKEAIKYLKSLPGKWEIGLFLEVDPDLADRTNVSYPVGSGDRAHADHILLSGYEIAERKRMIDEIFSSFRKVFGYYPVSAGAWYIDAVSQNYLREKYGVTALLDVADQYQTDTYGIWGSPWSVPFIPSKYNPLVPAIDSHDNSGIVKIRWAARDPVHGYGLDAGSSTYSVQANDYIKGHGFDTGYFGHLADIYLTSPENEINQLTVGLEAGQEGFQFLDEFTRQLDSLSRFSFITMGQFARIFTLSGSGPTVISGADYEDPSTRGYFINFPRYRAYLVLENRRLELRDLRIYDPVSFFPDVFAADRSLNLKRILPACIDGFFLKNPFLISDGVRSIDVSGVNGEFMLDISGDRDAGLSFDAGGIRFDGREVFKTPSDNRFKRGLEGYFYDLLLNHGTRKNSRLHPDLLLSRIDGDYYLGLPLYPDRLLGFRSTWPFIGIYRFPFQTLSKFKKIDFGRIYYPYEQSFYKQEINCTIKL